jgi:hypothetical protein
VGTGGSGHAGSTGTAGGGGAGHTGTGGTPVTGGAFTTSVPAGTKLTGLTSAQATQLCSDIGTFINHTFIPNICNESASLSGLEAAYIDLLGNPGATDAQLRADCTAATADAGTSRCTGELVDGGVQTCNVSSIPSTCQATVGQYGTCLNDTNAATAQFYGALPKCNAITAASVTALFAADGGASQGPPEPSTCSMFDSTCTADAGTAALTNMSPLPMPSRMKR